MKELSSVVSFQMLLNEEGNHDQRSWGVNTLSYIFPVCWHFDAIFMHFHTADLLQVISHTGDHITWEIQLIKDNMYNYGKWDYQILANCIAQQNLQLPSEEIKKNKNTI